MSSPVLEQIVRAYRAAVRLDAGPSQARPHSTGGLIVWGTATTVGVLDYPEFGTAELRDADQVFDPTSMATAIGVPLTLDHPPVEIDGGLVTPDTVRDLVHGWVVEVARRDNDLRVLVVLASREAIDAYNSGVRELSFAYRSRYVMQPGTWTGPDGPKPYTGSQTEIRYNALAQVPLARAGHTARLDAAPPTRGSMNKITIGKHTATVPTFVGDAITAQAKAHTAAVAARVVEAAAGKVVRADAIETATITIDGTDLVLPKGQIEAIIAMITAMPAGAAADPKPAEPVTPAPELDAAPRMDAKNLAALQPAIDAAVAKAVSTVPKLVEAQVQVRLDAVRTRERIERISAPLLGDGFNFGALDEHAIAAAAVIRTDAAAKDEVERLATAARGGDLRAAGRLEQRLDDAVRTHHDAHSTAGEFGLAIDAAMRAGGVRTDAAKVNEIDAARLRARARARGEKPPAPVAPVPVAAT